MTHLKVSWADLLLAAMMIAAGLLALWGSVGLPAPVMEPIGPAAFPRAAGFIVLAFGVVLAIAALRGRGAERAPSDGYDRRPVLALLFVLLTVVYVAAMDLGWIGFRLATIAYLFILGSALFGFRPRQVAASGAIAVVLAVAVHFLFTRFLFIDLP